MDPKEGADAPVKPVRRCPICDGQAAECLRSLRFLLPEAHPLTERYSVVRCVACGFVYADTASTQADYDRYYGDLSKYADVNTSTGAGEQPWDQARLRDTALDVIQEMRDRSAHIVDVGCANGGLLVEFARQGFTRLIGVDPSPSCVKVVKTLGIAGYVGTVFQLPEEIRGADCLILSHVLEHVRDVGQALQNVRDTIGRNASIYVEVPDATRYAQFIAAPFQDFNVEHINHFSSVSLTNALHAAGFRVERVGVKTIKASETVDYPAVWAFARSSDVSAGLVFDDSIEPAIRAYISSSASLLGDIDAHLRSELSDVRDVVVWGAGQTTLTVLASSALGGARVLAIADSNPRYHGQRLAGIPVIPPSQLVGFDAPIVIGSVVSHAAISRQIRAMGLPNRIVSLRPTAFGESVSLQQ